MTGALLGLALWAVGMVSRRFGLSEFYLEPCTQSVWVLTGSAMIAATGHIVFAGAGSWLGAGAFAAASALALLLNRDRPHAVWAHLALLGFVEFTICGLGLAMGRAALPAHQYGLLFMADGLALLAAAEVLRVWFNRGSPPADVDLASATVGSRWSDTLLTAIPVSTLVLTLVADILGLVSVEQTWRAGVVFLLGTATLLWVTRLVPWRTLVYVGLAQLAAGTFDLTSCATGWSNVGLLAGWLAVAGALLGLASGGRRGVARGPAVRLLLRAMFSHSLCHDGGRPGRGHGCALCEP